MRRYTPPIGWPRCDPRHYRFALSNTVWEYKLKPMVYAYLLLIEDRRTHTCHPSYNTIVATTGLAKNTAMKSVSTLLEMELIAVESSGYFDKRGMKWKGNNLYTILPVRPAVDVFHQRQLRQLELDTERSCVHKWQAEYNRRHPRTPLCPPAPAQATLTHLNSASPCVPFERQCARGRKEAG